MARGVLVIMLAEFGDTCRAAGDLPAAVAAWRQAMQVLDDLGWPDVGAGARLEQAGLPARSADSSRSCPAGAACDGNRVGEPVTRCDIASTPLAHGQHTRDGHGENCRLGIQEAAGTPVLIPSHPPQPSGPGRKEARMSASTSQLLGMAATAYGVIAPLSALLQARQMLARRSSREVSVRFFASYAGGYAIWLLYGLSAGSTPLIVVDAVGVLCAGLTLAVALALRGSLVRLANWTGRAAITVPGEGPGPARAATRTP